MAPLIPEKVTGLCVSHPDAEVSPVTIREKSEKNKAVSLTALAELSVSGEKKKMVKKHCRSLKHFGNQHLVEAVCKLYVLHSKQITLQTLNY